MMIKNKALFILLTFILFIGCANTPIVNDLNDIEETIDIGNKIIEAANDYKNKYGTYPETLEELVPEYFDKVPKTRMKKMDRERGIYVYRGFNYGGTENGFGLNFYASLNGIDCYNFARDTCSDRFFYSSNGYENFRSFIKLDQASFYKGWLYYKYRTCPSNINELECKFEKQLKQEKKEVSVELE